tara:strand:- start:81 stop:290 length:210 start_codon:yes stop_codon:yes gene_type:complete
MTNITNLKDVKCVLCEGYIQPKKTEDGVVYWRDGNNAQPIMDGRCCDECNNTLVIPARMDAIFHHDLKS